MQSSHHGPPQWPDAGDLGPAGPAEVLAVVENQRHHALRQLDVDSSLLYLCWGTAMLLGYAALYLGSSHGREPTIDPTVSGFVFSGLLVAAAVATGVHIYRRVRGLRGPGSTQGSMYSLSWVLGFAAMSVMGSGLIRAGMSDELADLFFFAVSGLIVGLLHLAGGAVWLERSMYALGAWVIAVFSAATLVGLPLAYVLAAALAGGAFLGTGIWLRLRQRDGAATT